ncbi:hypothetical protein V7S57_02465 [Caulobacter sp. CCNWLY153]|uniref:hypothetical protein n=1 Tax=unclassified Caulobacter TaxID=2648921 RepID=UPI002FF4164C
MAGNDLTNASGLDGPTGWTGINGAVAIDESVRGAPGRAVIWAGRTATGAGQTVGAYSGSVAVAAGALVEVAGMYGASSNVAELALAIYSGATLVSRTIIPRSRDGAGGCRFGASERLHAAYSLMVAPAAGQARLEVVGTAGGAGALEAWLTKPYLDGAWEPRPSYVWDPGAHLNADLSGLRRWPPSMPPILLDGYSPDVTPLRGGVKGDSGRTFTRRLAEDSAERLEAQLRLDMEQLTELKAFAKESEARFLFVKPDTQELCKAMFVDGGDPVGKPNGVGGYLTSFVLEMEIL